MAAKSPESPQWPLSERLGCERLCPRGLKAGGDFIEPSKVPRLAIRASYNHVRDAFSTGLRPDSIDLFGDEGPPRRPRWAGCMGTGQGFLGIANLRGGEHVRLRQSGGDGYVLVQALHLETLPEEENIPTL